MATFGRWGWGVRHLQVAQFLGRTAIAGVLSVAAVVGVTTPKPSPLPGPSFVVAQTYEPPANVPGDLVCAGREFCMQVASATLGDAIFPMEVVLVTHDGGLVWGPASPLPFLLALDASLRVACTAPGVCVVGGFGEVARTTNGGATWRLRYGFPPSWELGVNYACLGDGACIGVGAVAKRRVRTEWLGAHASRATALLHAGALPPGFSPRSISCAGPSRCVATGALQATTGAVLVATKVGEAVSWHEVHVVPHWVIEAGSCPTTSVCFGLQGRVPRPGRITFEEIVRSTDGGTTWSGLARVAGPFLPAVISCITAAVCATSVGPDDNSDGVSVLILSSSSLSASVGSVTSLTTTDGGHRWQHHVVLSGLAASTPVQGGASCLVSGVCVADASGGDGGRTVLGPSSGELATVSTVSKAIGDTSVVCTTGDTCYRVDDLQGTAGYSSALLVSDDDGVTWSPVALPAGDEPVEVGGCQGPAVCEVIALRGVALHEQEQGNFAYAASSVIDLTTTDAGASWSSSTIAGPYEIPQAASCSSTTQCSLALMASVGPGELDLYSTQDGVTWSKTPVPGSGGLLSDALGGQTVDVTCGLGGTCLFLYQSAFGGVATFLRSTDGGATWIVSTPPGNELLGTSCFAASTCVIAYANVPANRTSSNVRAFLTATTDGGATWSTTPLPVPSGSVTDVTCATALDCTALYENTAEQTVDGGMTWSAIGWPKEPPLSVSSPLEASCSPTTCLVVETTFSLSFTVDSSSTTLLRLSP